MSRGDLQYRFVHGNFAKLSSWSPEADFFLGVPARQRELVKLAEAQVGLARETIARLEHKNDEVSAVIRNEVSTLADSLAVAVSEGAEAVAHAVDVLGDRLSLELVEVRWELQQIQKVNTQILEVLKRPRSTEAAELIQQGVRNLVNDKLEQAEERFLLALRLDNTDYQVLMNLAAVELRKGDSGRALQHAADALTLPATLGAPERATALEFVARLHYVREEYGQALAAMEEACKVSLTARRLLASGIYRALASCGESGFDVIAQAIERSPELFVVAAQSGDLEKFPRERDEMLGRLVTEALQPLWELHRYSSEQAAVVDTLPHLDDAERELFETKRKELETFLATARGYVELRAAATRFTALGTEPVRLKSVSSDRSAGMAAEEEHQFKERRARDRSWSVSVAMVLYWLYGGPILALAAASVEAKRWLGVGMSSLVFWPGLNWLEIGFAAAKHGGLASLLLALVAGAVLAAQAHRAKARLDALVSARAGTLALAEAKAALEKISAVPHHREQPATTTVSLEPAVIEEVAQLMGAGLKINAIKRYREATGLGLADAKAGVERIHSREGR